MYSWHIPTLIQLCAESVASHIIEAEKVDENYVRYLKSVQLPSIIIKYIEEDFKEGILQYKKCSLLQFIKTKWRKSTGIVPSVASLKTDIDFKIYVGSEKVLYVSTISDLGLYMLKLDIPMGDYWLHDFRDGYVLRTNEYTPRSNDVIQVFNTRCGNKGMSGTYYDGNSENIHHLRIFNQSISKHIDRDWWEQVPLDSWITSHKARVLESIPQYHNIPVLFYLTKNITEFDLSMIKLEGAKAVGDCGNVRVCWHVFHSEHGRIGMAVQQKELFKMMGDQAGLALFAANGFRALGNFKPVYIKTYFHEVFEPDHKYVCELQPCFCSVWYDGVIEERKQRMIRLTNYLNELATKRANKCTSYCYD